MADMNSTAPPSIPRTRKKKSKSSEGVTERSDSTPNGELATVHDFQFARAYSTLKNTPKSRQQECLKLLHEQTFLEIELRTVRGKLAAIQMGRD